jgi:hypothetical protein
MLVLDSLPVPRNAIDSYIALALCEEVGCRRQVWQEEEHCNPHEYARSAEDEEHIHPARQRRIDVPNRISDQSAEHCCNTVSAVVRPES